MTNILEKSEAELEKCVDFDTYSSAKNPLPFIVDVIQTHQLAPTGDSLADTDSAVQSYRTMKQLSGESANKYRIRMADKVRILERLGLDVPS